MRRKTRLLLWVLLIALTLIAACGGGGGGSDPPPTTTYSISGSIISAGTGTQGITVSLSGARTATASTDSSGNYSFTGLANGSYTLTPSKTGLTFNPTNIVQTVNSTDIASVNFVGTANSSPTYSISGIVTLFGTGLSGVTMTLGDAGSGSVNTDESGNYSFTGLGNGPYTITPSRTGYTFNPTSIAQTVINSNISGVDISALPLPTISISPSNAIMTPYTTQQFTATVANLIDMSIVWSIDEVNSGWLSSSGLFAATVSMETYTIHIRATSLSSPNLSTTSVISVLHGNPATVGTFIQNQSQYSLNLTNLDPTIYQETVNAISNTFLSVYPLQVARFNPNAPNTINILIDPSFSGVAQTSGSNITISSSWLKSYSWDIDVVTHEAFHVVQNYSYNNPSWAVEGLADYNRDAFGIYNPEGGWSMPDYSSSQNYTDSYRVTARFFKWLELNINQHLLEDLDAVMRDGQYTSSFWVQETGKTIDQLWAEYSIHPSLP